MSTRFILIGPRNAQHGRRSKVRNTYASVFRQTITMWQLRVSRPLLLQNHEVGNVSLSTAGSIIPMTTTESVLYEVGSTEYSDAALRVTSG